MVVAMCAWRRGYISLIVSKESKTPRIPLHHAELLLISPGEWMALDTAVSPSLRRLRFVQIRREAISRRCDRVEQHKGADLAAVSGAVVDDVHEHFLPGHAQGGHCGDDFIELLTALARLGPLRRLTITRLAIKALSHSYVVDRIFAARLRRKAHPYTSPNLSELPTLDNLAADIRTSDQEYIKSARSGLSHRAVRRAAIGYVEPPYGVSTVGSWPASRRSTQSGPLTVLDFS